MKGNPSTTQNNGSQAAVKPPRLPPEERFWQRYSPHHEFPLSVSSSVFIHIFGLVLLVFGGGFLLWILGNRGDGSLPVDAITVEGGGGGNPQGLGNERGDGILPSGPEAVNSEPATSTLPKIVSNEPLKTPDPRLSAAGDVLSRPEEGIRFIEDEAPLTDKRLDEIHRRVREYKTQGIIAGQGKGGTGKGGGRGRGDGPGVGNAKGSNSGKPLTQRQKRRLRWTIVFGKVSGEEYARRLSSLGAVLAVPGPDGRYFIIRDLLQHPARPQREDLGQFKGMQWMDTRPESVRSLALTLEIPVPNYFAAFFPIELEDELLKKEMAYFHARQPDGVEDDIDETVFELILRDYGRYEPMVSEQKLVR